MVLVLLPLNLPLYEVPCKYHERLLQYLARNHTICLFYSYEGAVQMGISRYLHSTVVVGTKLYVVGGLDETQSLQATMYVADPNNKYQVSIIYTCR